MAILMGAKRSEAMAEGSEFTDDITSLSYAARRQNLTVSEVVLPADAHVVLRDMRFHYLDWGNAGRRQIVFLHGGGLNAHTYDLVCLALRAEYHCLALDQRGHGDSEWSPVMDYDMTAHADDIDAFTQRFCLDRFVLVGMSMGGVNAIQYAGSHPERLAALVIIDVGPETQALGSRRIRDFMAESTSGVSVDEFVSRAMAFNPRRDPLLLRRSLLHNLRKTPDGKLVWKWDPRPRRVGLSSSQIDERRNRLWQQVDRISCPTLVVRGAESDVFSEENAAKLVARLNRGSYARIDQAGHTVQGDNPAGLVRAMRSFLTVLDP
jgi:esterase